MYPCYVAFDSPEDYHDISMSWQLLTIMSVTTFSVSVLLQRLLLHKHKSDPYAYVIAFQGLTGVLVGVYAIFHGFQLPELSKLWFPVLATMILYGVGHVAYAKTLQLVEASAFPILFATQAIWVMSIGVLFFDETLNIRQVIGALLVLGGVALLTKRPKAISKFKLERSVVLGLLTGLLFGLASVAWAYVGRHADTVSWTALGFIGPAIVVLLARPQAARKLKPFFSGEVAGSMVLLCLIFSVSGVTLLQAYQSGNLSVVAPLRQTGIIVTLLLGVFFLHERDNLRRKVLGALISFVGALLII